jgi:uncharacterized protein
VAQPRYPLRFNVGFLRKAPIGTNRDFHFEYPAIRFSPEEEFLDFSGVARINRTPQGMLVEGEFKGAVGVECVRCLVSFLQPLSTSFSELYAFDQRSVSESDLILPEDANIDLGPIVREYLLIEVPISPICRPDCKGLCPVCGEDLNQVVCEHVVQSEP